MSPEPARGQVPDSTDVVAKALEGQTVLLIMIQAEQPDSVRLLVGRVQRAGDSVAVIPDTGTGAVPVPRVGLEYNVFKPEVLPRLVAKEEDVGLATRLAHDVSRCIVMLSSDAPSGSWSAPGFIAGAAVGSAGQIYLMQAR